MQTKHRFLIFALMAALISYGTGLLLVSAAYGDVVVGEQHTMAFPAQQTMELVEDVLRGDGILFDVLPDRSIVTLWRPADNPPGFFHSLAGMKPRYRYEITIIAQGGSKSEIVANVRTEYVPDSDIDKYKASRRFNFFHQLDELAATLPPPPKTPSTGGVNFVLLPNENLEGLAKRVTGEASNWKVIAEQNGLKSPTDVTPFQSIWVPDTLLKNKAKPVPAAP